MIIYNNSSKVIGGLPWATPVIKMSIISFEV